ncbi:MAG TPA: rRNA maturation RNase YbeY [Candidatus Dormibacteraeota bacterium]|nr:rRNA maturation RNase YbeY [Candidatus Dormibacteraeota bacterium]
MTLIEVDVVRAVPAPVPPAYVRAVLARAAGVPEIAARMPAGAASVAVRIMGMAEMRRLNRRFAGEDHATDVLSFAGAGAHLGDLAVSWPAVVRQARTYRHTQRAELALLCVHGLLHLLGWDHATAAEEREMTRLTLAALAAAGVRLAPRRL